MRGALIQHGWCPYTKGKLDTGADRYRKNTVGREFTCKSKEVSETTGVRGGAGADSPTALRRSQSCPHLDQGLTPAERETLSFCHLSHLAVVLVVTALGS